MHQEIIHYMSGTMATGLLLFGTANLSTLVEDAKKVAAKLLNCSSDRIYSHPDFLLIRKEEKATSIGVDALTKVLSLEEMKAGHVERFVVLIEDFHLLTVSAQNRLLKILEDGENVVVIGLCTDESNILTTIKSRVRLIRYQPVSKEQFIADGRNTFEYYLSSGFLEIQVEKEALITVKSCEEAFLSEKPEKFLSILHLLKEKDKENFFEKFPHLVKPLWLCFGEMILTRIQKENQAELFKVLQIVQQAIIRSDKHYYTRDSFFLDVVNMIESFKKK